MFLTIARSFFSVILSFAFVLLAKAQQTHFVYLQTEEAQPFYIKLNNKVISSSPTGYLILPKLTDGDYNLSIGFPKNEFPEENYQLAIDKKDEGFLLKNFNEKGWGLFNLQSYNVIMGGNTNEVSVSSKNLQDDPFSKMLADVVKDSTILQKNEPEKKETVATQVNSTSTPVETVPIIINTDSSKKIDSSSIAVQNTSLLHSQITLVLSKKNSDGLETVYVDHNGNLNDTIRIFIPSEKNFLKTGNSIEKVESADTTGLNEKQIVTQQLDSASVQAGNPMPQQAPDTTDTTTITSKMPDENTRVIENNDSTQSNISEEIKSQPVSVENSKGRKDSNTVGETKAEIAVLPKVVTSSKINSDCKAFANNEDFLKLRKKMASENSDDDMIKIAKKVFRSKCFSTEQIKNLSFLFLSDEGKYRFFDESYAFASDSDQFFTLQSQLTDSYYLNRFKAMIHK